jgi:hypothetical protein
MIFSEIRADHTTNGLSIEFEAKPIWEPQVEALLARQQQVVNEPPTVFSSERKMGLSPLVMTLQTDGDAVRVLERVVTDEQDGLDHQGWSVGARLAAGAPHDECFP